MKMDNEILITPDIKDKDGKTYRSALYDSISGVAFASVKSIPLYANQKTMSALYKLYVAVDTTIDTDETLKKIFNRRLPKQSV
jgi:hypothetical protein